MESNLLKAMAIFSRARHSSKYCCLAIYSDYNFCWEIKWVYADDKKHTEHRTKAHDTLLEAMQDFEIRAH